MEPKSHSSDWYNDDSFLELCFPYMFPDHRFAKAAEQVPLLQTLTGCQTGAVLDLACGPGRYAVPFAQHGYDVTGVDRTGYLLDKAHTYAAQQQVDVEFVQQDMRRFVRPDTFDLALNLFTSFGYFADSDDNQLVLQNVCTSLKDGGAFVLDMMGKEVLARIYSDSDVTSAEDGTLFAQQRQAVNDWCEMDNVWTLVREGDVQTFRIRHWIYSGFELKQMLLKAGFSTVSLFGDFDGSQYGPQARRLIAVSRK